MNCFDFKPSESMLTLIPNPGPSDAIGCQHSQAVVHLQRLAQRRSRSRSNLGFCTSRALWQVPLQSSIGCALCAVRL